MESLLTPGEMIEFLSSCVLHLRFDRAVPCDRRVALVQRLRRDLAGVIHAHQAGGVRFLAGIHLSGRHGFRRVGARRVAGRGRDGSQRIVGAGQKPVQRRQLSIRHL